MKTTKIAARLLLCVLMISLFFSAFGTASAEQMTISGLVVDTDAGIIIEADDDDYLVTGQDLSGMVGKEVEVTGMVTETEEGKTIEVTAVEEIQE